VIKRVENGKEGSKEPGQDEGKGSREGGSEKKQADEWERIEAGEARVRQRGRVAR
jgi:hypothetical protein